MWIFGDKEAVWFGAPKCFYGVSIHNVSPRQTLGRLESLITIRMFDD